MGVMEATTRPIGRGHAAKGGIVAGVIGGIVLSVLMLVMSVSQRQDVWRGAKMAGMPFLGERAAQPGFDLGAVLVGLLSHFAVSIAWGVLFGLIFFGWSKGLTVLMGAFWGIVVWLGMFYVVLPIVGLSNVARMMPVGVAVFEHVLFGLAVGFGFLPFQRERRIRPPVERPVPVTP